VPICILFALLVASITTTVVILHSSIRSVQLTYQDDIAKVNDNLLSMQSRVKALTQLVSESLNATDEYIQSMTDTVSETKDVITQDLETAQDIQDNQNSLMAVQSCGMFTILVILVSGYHLSQHFRHMHSPVVQRKIMAVLWMTPIYSLASWLSLVFESAEPYLSVIREFYESYCVYIFLSFLIAVLGRGDRRAVIDLLEQRADQLSRPDKCRCGPKFWRRCWRSCRDKCGKRGRVPNPSDTQNPNVQVDELGNYVSPARIKAEAVLDQCQMYAMQFVLLRPLTAIAWLVSNKLFEPTQFLDPTCPQLYITIVTNCSIFFAFRGLVRFYHATSSNLAWCNPWPKFMCIKGVVFMTFWQKMMLSLIVNLGFPDKFDSQEDANDFIMLSQNFLICLEMLFSAVAHCFVFSTDEWAEGYREREEEKQRNATSRHFGDSVALGDFINDVKVVMASKKRRTKSKPQGTSLSSTLEDDDEATTSDSNMKSESINATDEGNGDAEHVTELVTLSPAKNEHRQRVGTEDSVESDGEIGGNLARIEQFITSLTPPLTKRTDDNNEIV